MQGSSETWNYSYDTNGLRTQRSNGSTTYRYWYNDSGLLLRMEKGNTVYSFTYDAFGRPVAITEGNTRYFYVLNQQGDVVAIINGNGDFVVEYYYDAWGRLLSTTGTLATTLGANNPLRYRGYVYDTETGLYYLQSRYYNPTWGRFINADKQLATDSIIGLNLFVYCNDNPVNMYDPNGEMAITTLILIGSAIVGIAAGGYTAYVEYKAGFSWDKILFDSVCVGFSAFSIAYTGGMSLYQCYQNYCYLHAITPVTDIGISPSKATTIRGPYSNLTDPPNVAPGKDFTASQKSQIIQQNQSMNGGVVRSDLSGIELVQPQKSMKGTTLSPLEWQIDHIIPKSAGGTNSFSNAQVLSRLENRIKWDY